MKTLVLTGDDLDTDKMVELAIKMGMDAEKVASEKDLVPQIEAVIDPELNEEGWRDAVLDYIQYDLGIYVIEQIIPNDISADVIRDHVDNAVNKLKEAKKLLTEAL